MSNPESWALVMAINAITIGIALGAYLHDQGWTPAKWMTLPTTFVRNRIQQLTTKLTTRSHDERLDPNRKH